MVKFLSVIAIIPGLAVGIGATWLASPLVGIKDPQLQIVIAIVLSVFASMSFYFMTKGSGSG